MLVRMSLATIPLFTLLNILFSTLVVLPAQQQPRDIIEVIPIKGMIDLGLSGFVARSLREAQQHGAQAVILEIDTFGGRIDAATEIRDALFDCGLQTVAFINKRAISAGALISIASQEIVMVPGATIGDALPVTIGPGGTSAQPTGEKEISYVRKEFKATAEKNGHSPKLAEAMVDPDIELLFLETPDRLYIFTSEEWGRQKKEFRKFGKEPQTLVAKDKILTMTVEEAIRFQLAAGKAASLEEVLELYHWDNAKIIQSKTNWSENLVRFLTNPAVTGLLILLGIGGLYLELKMPGWGIAGTFGIICLALFFGGRYFIGLANFTELLLCLLGILLLAIEIFVIPGFGITGISGIIFILLSIYLAFMKYPIPRYSWEYQRFTDAVSTMATTLLILAVLVIISLRYLPQSRFWRRIALTTEERTANGFYTTPDSYNQLIGKIGITRTILRPAGKISIEGKDIAVITEGDFIEPNQEVIITRVDGNQIIVRAKDEGESEQKG